MINVGVFGDIIVGGFSCVGWILFDDVDVMIVVLGGNDFLCGILFEVSCVNLDGIFKVVEDVGVDIMLVVLEVLLNYGFVFK